MTTRCPFSDPQDPVSRVSEIRGQGPASMPEYRRGPDRTLGCGRGRERQHGREGCVSPGQRLAGCARGCVRGALHRHRPSRGESAPEGPHWLAGQ
ncbi:hypothetical protein FGK60_10480 [Streptomyces sp. DASNCL29]|nr:hypothetical protein FGK60_10480 [Streptomyces sp. DASNCL29]